MAIPDSTYGQRPGLITRQSLQSLQDSQAAEYGESFGSAVWGQWRGVLAGVAVIAIMLGGYFALNKGLARVFDRFWTGDSAPPGIEDAYKRSGLADAATGKDLLLEQVHNACRSRSEFVVRGQPKNADGTLSDSSALLKQATYLSCLAGERPSRFCQAAHRSHLLMSVRDYFKLMASAKGNATPGTDPRVLAALTSIVERGYIARRDLVGAASGWSNDLEAQIANATPSRRGCG
jgi:hypothetical protein